MRHTMKTPIWLLLFSLAGCTVGPDYVKPEVETPAAFKQADGTQWKRAEPQDHVQRGPWWQVFNDELLNQLVPQVEVSNQTLRAALARYQQAVAGTRAARADLFPTIGSTLSRTRSQSSQLGNRTFNGNRLNTNNTLSANLSWEADIWGRISRTVEANRAGTDASASDVSAALLSAQAELVQNYFALRLADSQRLVLEDSIATYEKSLQQTRNRYAAGVASKADVVQAETQLNATRAQALDTGIQRAQLENAIAVLTGKPPSSLSIPVTRLTEQLPLVPVGLPSQLLERRPDVAAAERRVAAANAQIGVAKAAFFPTVNLSVNGGFQSTSSANLIDIANRFWSVGPALALTLFDAGRRRALSDQAIAAYDEQVANYRQTTLTAFQEVEDNLAALNVLQQEIVLQTQALQAARQSLEISTNQYQAGLISYLDVVTVANIALNNERTLLTLRGQQFAATVQLMRALGGGWEPGTALPHMQESARQKE